MFFRNATSLTTRTTPTRHILLISRRTAPGSRKLTDSAEPPPEVAANTQEGWLFVDSVFPIRLGIWDLRHYIGAFRAESLVEKLENRLSAVKTHRFKVLSLQPYQKDGGVFVKFSYSARDTDTALKEIENDLREQAEEHGGMPSWAGLDWGNVWLVKGQPWLEDMNRYPSPIVKTAFEGPDPYGRIHDLSPPQPGPAGSLRYADISFVRVRSATIARNALHGYRVSDGGSITRLETAYQRPIQAHAIRAWLTAHPRIALPILFFLLGTLTYTIFDPIRALFIEGKLLNWFDYREYGLYKWLRANTLDRLSLSSASADTATINQEGWKERKEAEIALRSYLSDPPSTLAFVHGPQGSGKSRMVSAIMQDTGRKTLVIDCAELMKASSDTKIVATLAQQTGYTPIFTFLNSLNNLIDIASMGIIGQKAGFTSSLTDQLKQILEVVGTALKNVNHSLRNSAKQNIIAERKAEARKAEDARRRALIRQGIWHDGRLDCVAGNGLISELGFGDECPSAVDSDLGDVVATGAFVMEELEKERQVDDELAKKERRVEEVQAVETLPVVVIKNYGARGGVKREDVLAVLSQWASTLVENRIAHVIIVSDNRENAKLLTRALPTKPLNTISLSDADAETALSFVKQRLRDAGLSNELTPTQIACIERLGGRASDLESLIYKVRNGQCQSIEDAVEDIISRGVSELRKNAFGDDIEDAKSLRWTREQVWTVLKQLSSKAELPYYDVLSDFPFKGDELPLRTMEHAEIISIGTLNGRPSTIRPGKPVLKYVFERLVNDPIFRATQDMAVNDKLISSADNTIKACEAELTTLQQITGNETFFQSLWRRKPEAERKKYLLKKMHRAQANIQTLEKQNAELRKVLAKGG
ncbi:RNA12 protein-domain-containing protein [Melanogaster broomeanus]|nr:RNA12 protein-domain-containing protein [Melanogaster broomeanus]